MNDDLLKKVALLQIKEKVMKDSGDVLTDLADMQALRQFSADLKELIDEQHAAGAIPADPLSALRERLMKVLEVIKAFREWQLEQLEQLAPFTQGNPKVSLEQINTMISVLPPLNKEEHERIEEVISSCDSNEWYVKGNVIHLRSELEAVQEALLPEFSKYCDGNKGCTLKETLGANVMTDLQKLAELHEQQATAATEIESLLQQGNYRTAQAKGKEAKLLSAEGKSQVGFTDIDFANQAAEITKCDETLKKIKSHLASNVTSTQDKGNAAADLHNAETMLKDAQGELREELSAAASSLKGNIAKAKKARTTKVAILGTCGVLVLCWAFYSQQANKKEAAEKKAIAEQRAADEKALAEQKAAEEKALAEQKAAEEKAIAEQKAAEEKAIAEQRAAFEKALANGDSSVSGSAAVYALVAEHAMPAFRLYSNRNYKGWVKKVGAHGKLLELYQYDNGKNNGYAVALHSNGERKWEGRYADGIRDGSCSEWYESGQKKSETNYKDGKQHGLETKWEDNGLKKYEVQFKDDKRNGLSTWWHENGQKESETNYQDGKKHGLETWWDEEGNVTSQTMWEKGKKVE